jgi:hypothetical protein
MELSVAQRDAPILARSAAQNLDRNLLFQIFDYLRDGRAFLQCEATCADFRSLLREEAGIGQKLWQARPIAYGARMFAIGGTAPDTHGNPWAGTIGWAEHSDREICDGGREVVLGFACLDAMGAAQRSDAPIIPTLAGEQWTELVNSFYGQLRFLDNDEITWSDSAGNVETTRGPHVRVAFSQELVYAATDLIELWLTDLIKRSFLCSVHRDSPTISAKDIDLAGALSRDDSLWHAGDPGIRWALFDQAHYDRQANLEGRLGASAAHRIVRKLVRRAGCAEYTGGAHTHLWKLLQSRLCTLLRRVVHIAYCRENVGDWSRVVRRNPRLGLIEERGPQLGREIPLWPTLEDLACAAESGTGPINQAPCNDYSQRLRDRDDGSFRSDDCSDTSGDDDSSVGDESD